MKFTDKLFLFLLFLSPSFGSLGEAAASTFLGVFLALGWELAEQVADLTGLNHVARRSMRKNAILCLDYISLKIQGEKLSD